MISYYSNAQYSTHESYQKCFADVTFCGYAVWIWQAYTYMTRNYKYR